MRGTLYEDGRLEGTPFVARTEGPVGFPIDWEAYPSGDLWRVEYKTGNGYNGAWTAERETLEAGGAIFANNRLGTVLERATLRVEYDPA